MLISDKLNLREAGDRLRHVQSRFFRPLPQGPKIEVKDIFEKLTQLLLKHCAVA